MYMWHGCIAWPYVVIHLSVILWDCMLFTVVASPSLQSAAIWYFIAAVIALCVALDSYFVLPALVSLQMPLPMAEQGLCFIVSHEWYDAFAYRSAYTTDRHVIPWHYKQVFFTKSFNVIKALAQGRIFIHKSTLYIITVVFLGLWNKNNVWIIKNWQ